MRKLLSCLLLASLAGCSHENDCVSPVADGTVNRVDMEVTSNTRVLPGTYRVSDREGKGVLRILADNVTVDLGGVTIVGADDKALPDSFEGIAIRLEGRKGVTIRGGTFRGFRGGLYMKDCVDCVIEGCDVSDNRAQRLKSTPARCDDGADWLGPHFNDGNEWWTNYGAGIYLDHCAKCTVSECRGRRTQNGIVLRNTDDSFVYDNDMSWMSGWCVALWRSSRNEISHNRCDYGVRGYSFGRYDRGQDSAGILMFEQCSDNTIAYNSATHGGDGIFMYAGHETTQRTGTGGCNRNLLYRNDFSHAVANAIECTFSDGNRFLENILSDSNYGVWAGYSYNTVVSGNLCAEERVAGVAIEHGHKNVIEGNVFEKCATGVEVWWNENADFLKGPYGQHQNCKSEDYTVLLNRFEHCPLALRVNATAEAAIQSNGFDGCDRLADFSGKCPGLQFSFNRIEGESPGWFRNDTGEKIEIGPCLWKDHKPADTDDVTFALGPEELNLEFDKLEHGIKEPRMRGQSLPTWSLDTLSRATAPAPVSGAGTMGPLIRDHQLARMNGGMETIVIDEWGPCDPTVARLFPAWQIAWESADVFVFGPEGTMTILDVDGDVTAAGKPSVPGAVRVTALGAPPSETSVRPFAIRIKTSSGAVLQATGTILVASWEVQFRSWKPGEGEHGGYEKQLDADGWAKLMASPPDTKVTLGSLQTPWQGIKMDMDHFATLATTTMNLPAGKWRFTTMSDDGVRVFVDGKKIVDHWTWHAPTEDVATVELTAGAHEIKVEHFEIDGAEALDLAIEPEP